MSEECEKCNINHAPDYHDVVEVSRTSFMTTQYRIDIVRERWEGEQDMELELIPWSLHHRGEGKAIRLGISGDHLKEFAKALLEEIKNPLDTLKQLEE